MAATVHSDGTREHARRPCRLPGHTALQGGEDGDELPPRRTGKPLGRHVGRVRCRMAWRCLGAARLAHLTVDLQDRSWIMIMPSVARLKGNGWLSWARRRRRGASAVLVPRLDQRLQVAGAGGRQANASTFDYVRLRRRRARLPDEVSSRSLSFVNTRQPEPGVPHGLDSCRFPMVPRNVARPAIWHPLKCGQRWFTDLVCGSATMHFTREHFTREHFDRATDDLKRRSRNYDA